MSEVKEEHKITAKEGEKSGVVKLLSVAQQTAEELPDNKKYDVRIEITESDNE